MERAKGTGTLRVCADPYNLPASGSNAEPPGYDIDILREVARRNDMRLEMVWADTGTRGGLSRAFRNSISKGKCDVFAGFPLDPDTAEKIAEFKLAYTKPYIGQGFVVVVQGSVADAKSLEDLVQRKTVMGVNIGSPSQSYTTEHNIPRSLHYLSHQLFKALESNEVEAAFVWSPQLYNAKRDAPKGTFKPIPGFVPDPELRWNLGMVVPAGETAMREFLDRELTAMVASGDIRKIVERYGIPHFDPFN